MRAIRVLLVSAVLSGMAWVGSGLGAEEPTPDVFTAPPVDLTASGSVASEGVGTVELSGDAQATGEVRAALESLVAGGPVSYSWLAVTESDAAHSMVSRTGRWDGSTRSGHLSTEITMVEASTRVDPLGQAAAALGDGGETRSGQYTMTVSEGELVVEANGGEPEVVPAGPQAEEWIAVLDPNVTLLAPLLIELGAVERGEPTAAGMSYRVALDGDVVAPLGVESSLKERLEATGFDGVTGIEVPATVVIDSAGAVTIRIDLTPWWAAVKAEGPAVPTTTATVELSFQFE